MAAAEGPVHDPLVRPVTTELNDDAAPAKSDANPSQADAAKNNGPEPAPVKIRSELISGGNQESREPSRPPRSGPRQRPRRPPEINTHHGRIVSQIPWKSRIFS
jgi:hypothetical protein